VTTPEPAHRPEVAGVPVPLDRARAVAMAAVLSALADPVRLQVFRVIRDSGPPGASVSELTVPSGDRRVVKEAVDQLEAVGLVTRRRDRPGRRFVADEWTLATFDVLLGEPGPDPVDG
jgi:DNA-binding transcriptional ArsR family regulator